MAADRFGAADHLYGRRCPRNVGMPVRQMGYRSLMLATDKLTNAKLKPAACAAEARSRHRGARQYCNTHWSRSKATCQPGQIAKGKAIEVVKSPVSGSSAQVHHTPGISL